MHCGESGLHATCCVYKLSMLRILRAAVFLLDLIFKDFLYAKKIRFARRYIGWFV